MRGGGGSIWPPDHRGRRDHSPCGEMGQDYEIAVVETGPTGIVREHESGNLEDGNSGLVGFLRSLGCKSSDVLNAVLVWTCFLPLPRFGKGAHGT